MQRIKKVALMAFLNLAVLALPFLFAKAWHLAEASTVTDKTLIGKTESRVLPAGPNDGNITRLTATLLSHSHYLQHPLDRDYASKFLDRYLESLDGMRMVFLQSDIQEFSKYRDDMAELTNRGDTTPARAIFARFLERFEQHVRYVDQLLREGKFDFTAQERYNVDRKNAPYPKDLAEAKELWRKRLKYEILQERLQYKPKTTAAHSETGEKKADSAQPRDPPAGANGAKTAAAPKIDGDAENREISDKLTKRYGRLLHTLREYNSDDILELYLSALTHIYDPHSDYMGKSQLENFAIGMKLSLCGIGALLQYEDGYCKIKSLVPGGPAARSKKLHENDRIVAVAQGNQDSVDVMEETRLIKIVEMIRGQKGSEVRLSIIPADAADPSVRKEVQLIRDDIPLEDQEAKAKIFDLPDEQGKNVRLGMIDLPSFYRDFNLTDDKVNGTQKSTTVDVAKLLRKLKQENVAGIILDLRRNGGGSLEEAITLTGLFIKEGPVVQVKDPTGKISVDSDPDPTVLYEGPLMVLTSRFSASASEILAGALQDYGRALIVGDSSTHGKGTVQSLIKLEPYLRRSLKGSENPGAVKLTIRKFYRASGSSTQLKGVIPDVILPSINTQMETGEASLENPLSWDTIPSQSYEKLNRVEPFAAELRKRSEKRLASDADFRYLRDDIERMKKAMQDKSISLNEAERLKEKAEAEGRDKKRQAELKSRVPSHEKIYDISLKQAEQPGMPAPEGSTNRVATATGEHPDPTISRLEDESDEHALTAVDAALKEAKRILIDYIHLSSPETAIAAGPSGSKPAGDFGGALGTNSK